MPYIAFLDMLGTRAKASLGDEEYTKSVTIFNDKLAGLSEVYRGKTYAFSDSAYVQFEHLDKMVKFFCELRSSLMPEHLYFSAAVEKGVLSSKPGSFENTNGFFYSMKFTSAAAVKAYRMQSHCTGIGTFVSNAIVEKVDTKSKQMFCSTICLMRELADNEFTPIPVYDIAYPRVTITQVKFILADYLITAATNPRAARYYITALISMIKCIKVSQLKNDEVLLQIIKVLSFQTIPECFQKIEHNRTYINYFLFALIESSLSKINPENFLENEAREVCKIIISEFRIDSDELIRKLSKIPSAIITDKNKNTFLSVLFDLTQAN